MVPVKHRSDNASFSEASEDLLQKRVLLAYLSLAQMQTFWGARLLLLVPERSGASSALQYAGLLLGALSLTISDDLEDLKLGLRRGAFDFLVNTPDEALRILKNEARKRTPVSVALHGPPAGFSEELMRRGLAPAVVAAEPPIPVPQGWLEAGARVWDANGSEVPEQSSGPGATLLRHDFQDQGERHRFDLCAASWLRAAGEQRMARWLEGAGRVLPRVRPAQRFLVLTPAQAMSIARCLPQPAVTDKL